MLHHVAEADVLGVSVGNEVAAHELIEQLAERQRVTLLRVLVDDAAGLEDHLVGSELEPVLNEAFVWRVLLLAPFPHFEQVVPDAGHDSLADIAGLRFLGACL